MNNVAWRDFLALCKPKIVMMIVFTAMVGMFLSSPGLIPFDAFLFGSIGIGLAAASAACINHIVDEKIDAMMARTDRRPLPKGKLSTRAAVNFAAILCILSMLVLGLLVNVLTAVLTLVSLIGMIFLHPHRVIEKPPPQHQRPKQVSEAAHQCDIRQQADDD